LLKQKFGENFRMHAKKIEEIPARQLELLGKLPPEEWQETWEEVNLTAPDGEVTREHVQAVVRRRLQDHKQVANFQEPRQERVLLHPVDWVEVHGFQGNQSWNGLPGPIVEPEDNDGRVAVDHGYRRCRLRHYGV